MSNIIMTYPDTENPIDLLLAEQYLEALTGSKDTPVTFQTFPERDGDKNDPNELAKLTRQWTEDIRSALPKLQKLNQANAGVYVTVQKTNGIGRNAKDIEAIRALIVDFDGSALPGDNQWHLQPSLVVKTSEGKGHAYWLLKDPVAPDAVMFTEWSNRLIGHYSDFGSDMGVKDTARVLRLPGSYHVKGVPVLVTIAYIGSERYTVEEIMVDLMSSEEALNVQQERRDALSPRGSTNTTQARPMLPGGTDNVKFYQDLSKAVTTVTNCEEGGRNNTLNKAAVTLFGLYPAKTGEIRSALTEAAIDIGLGLSEIEATLNSAENGAKNKPIEDTRPKKASVPPSISMADQVINTVFKDVLYDCELECWMVYDQNGKWGRKAPLVIEKMVKDYLITYVPDMTSSYLGNVVELARLDVLAESWSEVSCYEYLPFTNGVLKLSTKELLEHHKDYGFTWQLPRAYSDVPAPYPNIDRFLTTMCCEDSELKQLALAFCQVALKGRKNLAKSLLLYGSGANGKGAYLNLLEALVGSNNTQSTTMKSLNNNEFQPASLKGKKLAVMPDENKYTGGLDVFKALTGGDILKFEQKGKDCSTFRFYGLVVMAANKPTFLGNSDGGVYRRIVSFPCKAFIEPKDRKDMKELFETELTAFTESLLALEDAWVDGVIHNALNIELIKELNTELAVRGDSVAAFYHSQLEPEDNARIPCGGLYQQYRQYCEESGLIAKSVVNFTPDLLDYCNTSQGLKVTKKRSEKGFYLLGLKPVKG